MPNSLKCRLKRLVNKGLISEKDLSRIYTDNDVIEELEKIKAKIEKEKEPYITMWETGFDDVSYGKYRAYNKAKDIINKHIEELKGENKSEREDTEFNHESFYEFLLNVINPNEMENYRSMFLSNGEIVK